MNYEQLQIVQRVMAAATNFNLCVEQARKAGLLVNASYTDDSPMKFDVFGPYLFVSGISKNPHPISKVDKDESDPK